VKKSCLVSLLIWAALSAAYWYWLRGHLNPPADVWVSIGAGFFMAVVVGTFRTAVAAAGDARRVRGALEPGGFMGEQPKDGETIAVAGTIRPLGEALLAPFSRQRAVLYSYEIEHDNPTVRSEMRTVKDYSGFALTPSVIDSMRGAVKLLCYPQLEAVPKEVVLAPDAVSNAKEYIANTQWTSMEGFNPAQIYREVREMLTDDDGQIRKDWRMGDLQDLSGTTLMEEVVAPGSQVFAIGKWSAEKRGLVPDSGVPARLVVGDARNVLKSLRGKVMGNLIGAILFGTVVNAILYAVVRYGLYGH
jgi:hypothetical protein